jgi:cytochrome c oxidase subunit 3
MNAGSVTSVQTSRVGMGLGLASISMLFLAFTSAYVVRHGLDPAWQTVRMPRILAVNTLVLLASSACLEKARRERFGNAWLTATLILGLLFVAGQFTAWWQLAARGIYLDTSSHSSFFYLLTALHGMHVIGGMLALGCARFLSLARRRRWLDVSALYWHFMAALWLYLLFLLFGLR